MFSCAIFEVWGVFSGNASSVVSDFCRYLLVFWKTDSVGYNPQWDFLYDDFLPAAAVKLLSVSNNKGTTSGECVFRTKAPSLQTRKIACPAENALWMLRAELPKHCWEKCRNAEKSNKLPKNSDKTALLMNLEATMQNRQRWCHKLILLRKDQNW